MYHHYHHNQTAPVVVLLSGWAGTGKDATATLLVEELDFYRLAFADALKREVATMTGIPLDVFHSHRKNLPLANHQSDFPTAQSPRDILIQRAATVRKTNPDHYAELVGQRVREDGGQRYVISDWRYPNESATLTRLLPQHRFLRVRIERHGIVPSADPTEHYLDEADFDVVIRNDHGIGELRNAIKAAVRLALHH